MIFVQQWRGGGQELTSCTLYGGYDDKDKHKGLEDEARAFVPDDGCHIG